MNGMELCDKLKESGTGEAKFKAAKEWAASAGKKLRDVDGDELLDAMSRPPALWPEGTVAKAKVILHGPEPEPDEPALVTAAESAPAEPMPTHPTKKKKGADDFGFPRES